MKLFLIFTLIKRISVWVLSRSDIKSIISIRYVKSRAIENLLHVMIKQFLDNKIKSLRQLIMDRIRKEFFTLQLKSYSHQGIYKRSGVTILDFKIKEIYGRNIKRVKQRAQSERHIQLMKKIPQPSVNLCLINPIQRQAQQMALQPSVYYRFPF